MTIADHNDHQTFQTLTVKATDAEKHLTATISPGDGNVVGVGMPVAVIFNQPIPKAQQANVERHITVTTAPAVAGAWHWTRANEVHWRPAAFWAAGTKVAVQTNLVRLDLGNRIWGADSHASTFTIGSSLRLRTKKGPGRTTYVRPRPRCLCRPPAAATGRIRSYRK